MTLHGQPSPEYANDPDAALDALAARVPFVAFLDVRMDRHGDQLTMVLPFKPKLIGNPLVPALHGGATAAFLEISALFELSRMMLADSPEAATPRLPRTIDFTVDYLRPGRPANAYAQAFVVRAGRRYASVRSEAWQESRTKPFAQATAHFLMPDRDNG